MPDYEVFVQPRRDRPYAHVGSVRAASDELALLAAKEAYARRDSPAGMWVVERGHVLSFDPRDRDLFELAGSRRYRQPSYFAGGAGRAPGDG